jgi:DNA polymerase-1
LPPAEISKRQRKIAKLVNFGYLYGASARKAHQSISEKLQGDEISITLREAEQFRRDFFIKYTGIDRFIKKVKRHIMVKKTIVSCFGRIRRLPQVESPYEEKKQEALRQGLNALIQGTASDLTQLALVQIHKFLIPYKSRFLFTVHDAILLEVHKSEKHLLTKLKQIMEQSRKPFNFPVEADISVFKNRWGND